MRNINRLRLQSVVAMILLAFMFTSATSFAGSIKEKMKMRLPEIKELKANGIIGEDSRGFLVVRKKSPDSTNLVQEENSDRQKVYSAIAKKQGTTSDFVGKRRAAQIAEKAKAGMWFQDKSGAWHQK